MKKLLITFLILMISGVLLIPSQVNAVTSLSQVKFNIADKSIGAETNWEFGFTIPENTDIGHIMISLAGYQPDLSNASLVVSGLTGNGTAKVGKSNPSCISNCDDIIYYLDDVTQVNAGTDIIFQLNDVINPEEIGQTGINFVHVFSSEYPQKELAYSSGDYLIKLVEADETQGDMPDSVTDEGAKKIQDVIINPQFYKEGSQTTRFEYIEEDQTEQVEDVTFDLLGKIKVVFKEPINLSDEESVHYIANIADYMTFENLYFWVDHRLMTYFGVPLEVTFYDLPYVWEPDVVKDDQFVLEGDELGNFQSALVDGKSQISFLISEGGGYRIVPKIVLYVEDDQEIKQEDNTYKFTGRISDPLASVLISLNGKEQNNINIQMDQQTGEFEFELDLVEGANLIEIESQSSYGQLANISKIIHYKKDLGGDVVEKQDLFNPLYFVAVVLIILAVVLVVAIIYLVKKK